MLSRRSGISLGILMRVTSGKIGCGLSFARVRGFWESKSEVIIYVDDDNVLNSNYSRFAEQTMAEDASLGACGGRVLAEYEGSPPEWFSRITVSPACCDLGPQTKHFSWIGLDRSQRMVPHGGPSGAGIVLRREAYQLYIDVYR